MVHNGKFTVRTEQDMDGTVRTMPAPQCEFCGSWDIDTVLKAFKEKGMRYSGADWKYGHPHKFYVSLVVPQYRKCVGVSTIVGKDPLYTYTEETHVLGKFYTEHLMDATDEQLAEWEAVVSRYVGIHFRREAGAIKYTAPAYNYQADGEVGVEGCVYVGAY